MRKFGVVISRFCPSVAAAHYDEFFNGTGLYRIDYFVGQSEHLVVRKAADNFARFYFPRRGAALCVFDNTRKILFFADIAFNMNAARKTRHARRIQAVLIAFFGRNDTVCGHQNRAVKTFKFFFLLPPRVAVVSDKVLVFFKSRIIVRRKHFRVGVNVNTGSFRLL